MKDGIKKVKVIDPLGLVYGKRDFKDKDKKLLNRRVWYYDKTAGGFANLSTSQSGFANLLNPFDYSVNDEEVFFYNDQISFATSDIYDSVTGNYLSYLNFATRPLNQLFAVENAFVVFALTRSTEKLVYYIDVGTIPEPKAKARIQEIARENSTQAKYDISTGKVVDTPDKIKLTSEIYLARRNATKGTEISTLSANNVNFGDVGILNYLKDNLDTSLFMPRSRRNKDYKYQLGYAKEIDNEEMVFYKFILKLRALFINGYVDIFGKHLISKNIVTQREWEEEVRGDILFVFNDNNNYERMKYIYDLQEKINMIDTISAYIKLPEGSNDRIELFDIENDVLKSIMQYTDKEIADWKKRMNKINSSNDETPDDMSSNNTEDQTDDIDMDNINEPGYITENIMKMHDEKNALRLTGDVTLKDIDTLSDFFEFLKEDDEIIVQKDGKPTNIKWKIKDGMLTEF